MNSSSRYFPHALLVAFIYTVFPVTAFGQGQASVQSLEHDGSERQFRIFQPSSHDPKSPLPLVVNIQASLFIQGFSRNQRKSRGPLIARSAFFVNCSSSCNSKFRARRTSTNRFDASTTEQTERNATSEIPIPMGRACACRSQNVQ